MLMVADARGREKALIFKKKFEKKTLASTLWYKYRFQNQLTDLLCFGKYWKKQGSKPSKILIHIY